MCVTIAKPRVPMARECSASRNTGTPMSSAAAPAASTAAASPATKGHFASVASRAAA